MSVYSYLVDFKTYLAFDLGSGHWDALNFVQFNTLTDEIEHQKILECLSHNHVTFGYSYMKVIFNYIRMNMDQNNTLYIVIDGHDVEKYNIIGSRYLSDDTPFLTTYYSKMRDINFILGCTRKHINTLAQWDAFCFEDATEEQRFELDKYRTIFYLQNAR